MRALKIGAAAAGGGAILALTGAAAIALGVAQYAGGLTNTELEIVSSPPMLCCA